jgi:putative nucleotidyltransferase with HDIG domain
MMENERPTRMSQGLTAAAFAGAVGVGIWRAPNADWDLALFGVLLGFSIFSDLMSIETESHLKVSGTFLAIVLAMVFLGGPPAALIGLLSVFVGWLRFREPMHDLLFNLLTYVSFPLVVGVGFHEVVDATQVSDSDPAFYALVFAVFPIALAVNFVMIGGYTCYLERSSFVEKTRMALIPILPSELAAALMAVGVALIYYEVGLVGVAVFGVVLIIFQYLLGALLKSQERATELEARSKQLASFQVGMMSALLRTLDLRDQMTARHSAAVARYSRAIAQRAGFSREQEELVHIAALLHDIGKFILPDRILKANVPLTDEDWMLIRRHPQQGAPRSSSPTTSGLTAKAIRAVWKATTFPSWRGSSRLPTPTT